MCFTYLGAVAPKQSDFRVVGAYKKRERFPGLAAVSPNSFTFPCSAHATPERSNPVSKERPTHVQVMFTWNVSNSASM